MTISFVLINPCYVLDLCCGLPRVIHPPSDSSGNSKVFSKKANEVYVQTHLGEQSTHGKILIFGDYLCALHNLIEIH